MKFPFVKLKPDLFTPLHRTPWAGRALSQSIKAKWATSPAIGESWEFSMDPAMPSLTEAGQSLVDLFAEDPRFYWGQDFINEGKTCDLLVKYIEAGSPLSVQVHPDDDAPQLKRGECGKPESWYVLSAEKGCGLYLGFKESYDADFLRSRLSDPAYDVAALLQFVPVKAGDVFHLRPGVVHAIGPGVLLIEPQRVRQGKSGKTYRLWDWNRLYDEQGQVDEVRGSPRELHVEESLACLSPLAGKALLESLREVPRLTKSGTSKVASFRGQADYHFHRVDCHGALQVVPAKSFYVVVLVVEGELKIQDSLEKASLHCAQGESVFLAGSRLQDLRFLGEGSTFFLFHEPMEMRFQLF